MAAPPEAARNKPLVKYGDVLEVLKGCSCQPQLDAIARLQRSIERRPGSAAAHFELAKAFEGIGLTVEARAQYQKAIRLSKDPKWKKQIRRRATALAYFDQNIDRGRVERYIEATSRPDGRWVLQRYLEVQTQRLGGGRRSAYSDSRFLVAANAYRYPRDYVANRLLWAIQGFCSDTTIEPCAMRYYTAGGLYAAGRKSEAAVWLGSIEREVDRVHGNAGLRALRRWEEGLNLYIQGMPRHALNVFETQHAELRTAGRGALAAEFDGMARAVREYLANLRLLHHDPPGAFEPADRSALLEVQKALASDAAILRYEPAADHKIVIVVVRRGSIDGVTLYHDQSQAGIERTAARMRDSPAAAGQLHDLVIAPVLEKLNGISTLAIVRNKELADIPFGALFDTSRGQYLAERFTIVHAPSAGRAVELSKRARKSYDSTLLAIGATQTAGEGLAGVDREIAAITEQSLCARVVAGKEATPEAIERALTENAVIHYGGHITRLRLLLAPSRGRDGLSAQEIARLRMDQARVVVLAGCRGAANGVADAFLTAGVPTVIATSYDLDDAEAPPTMRLLHTFLRNGDDAAEALRKTTLAELRSGRGVPLSVRFQAVGGTRALIH